jgi:hypothetical protein
VSDVPPLKKRCLTLIGWMLDADLIDEETS